MGALDLGVGVACVLVSHAKGCIIPPFRENRGTDGFSHGKREIHSEYLLKFRGNDGLLYGIDGRPKELHAIPISYMYNDAQYPILPNR